MRGIAGPHRTPRNNLQLALMLAAVAGALNSVGYFAIATYTSHMTGIVSAIADHLVDNRWSVVRLGLAAVASFLAGAALCAVIFNWGRRRHRDARYANVLVLEALLILLIGALAERLTWQHRIWVYLPVLCLTMGMQNAIITKLSGAQIRTTHVTGMITDIGIELGKLGYRSRKPGEPPVTADRRKLVSLTMLVVAFFGGSIFGAAGYLTFGFEVLIAPALALLIVASPPLLADLGWLGAEEGRASTG